MLAGSYVPRTEGLYAGDTELALARYLPSGALDQGFGSGGVRVIDLTDKNDDVSAIAMQPNGHFVLAGSKGGLSDLTSSLPWDVLVARIEGGTVFVPARPRIRGRGGRARVSKRRVFRLATTVSCPGAGPPCTVRVKARTKVKARSKGRKRTIQIGAGRFSVPAGASRRVKARLSPRGMRLLRKRRRLGVQVRVRVVRGERSATKIVRAQLQPVA